MKISGMCQECHRKPALVGFKCTIVGTESKIGGDRAVLLETGNRKLCIACFNEMLVDTMNAAQNLGEQARQEIPAPAAQVRRPKKKKPAEEEEEQTRKTA